MVYKGFGYAELWNMTDQEREFLSEFATEWFEEQKRLTKGN
jgi:hypothetical protein